MTATNPREARVGAQLVHLGIDVDRIERCRVLAARALELVERF
jgi:hypothetical protein